MTNPFTEDELHAVRDALIAWMPAAPTEAQTSALSKLNLMESALHGGVVERQTVRLNLLTGEMTPAHETEAPHYDAPRAES